MQETAYPVPIYVTANSLVNDHISLLDAIEIARDAGADGFEVRRELLPTRLDAGEVEEVRQHLQMFPSSPAYSIPLPLFREGRFERGPLQHALTEARAFGCHLAKFSPIGVERGESAFAGLSDLCVLIGSEAAEMVVTVENDQSLVSGDLTLWTRFFERAAACSIRMTFDLGNWTCVGGDPLQAAQQLGRYVTYIHAKSVEPRGGQCVAQPIRAAATTHPAFAYLPGNVPRALEFPISAGTHDEISTVLRAYVDLLRSGNFATS
jgi:sugar phosphate isomerase/epimerase